MQVQFQSFHSYQLSYYFHITKEHLFLNSHAVQTAPIQTDNAGAMKSSTTEQACASSWSVSLYVLSDALCSQECADDFMTISLHG